jgi:spore coat polysaccharide biosynthesis protein SpsF
MLWHVLGRLKACRNAGSVVVATTREPGDDPVARLARDCGAGLFRGDRDDVLDRYYHASRHFHADVVVRVCGDCPFIDPAIIDEMIRLYLDRRDRIDYIGMGNPSPFPYGLDAEVFSSRVLAQAWREARLPSEREHVTPYIWKNPRRFRLAALPAPADLSRHMWAVDNERDLAFARAVYECLYEPGKPFSTDDVLALLRERPELRHINENSVRREGYHRSLAADGSGP